VAEREGCARTSLLLGEPCYGTASQVRRWILVEQPGPWGANAVRESRLPEDVAVALQRAARAAGARLLLLRRHGRTSAQRGSAFAVVTTAAHRRVERFRFSDPAALLDVDWSPLRRFEAVGGEPVAAPLYLVCTNGKHDACCAELGRPVARALAAAYGDLVWEVSHIGGDRFAGNLLCLPDGIYYGRVQPATAVALVAAHQRGEVDVEHLRGRSFLPFAAQAAEHFVRMRSGITAIEGVLPPAVADLGEGTSRVTVAVEGEGRLAVTVVCSNAIDPQVLTCRSTSEEHPPRYRLLDVAPAG
jgi:hypothetical protein